VALVLAAAGCGGGTPSPSSADLVNGKKLFIGKGTCGSCHSLARAGTKGTQGPNLDDAFVNARDRGFGNSVIAGVVQDQIAFPRRDSIMPAKLLKGNDARDVAAYVGEVAGKPGQDSGLLASVGTANTANKVTTEQNGKLVIPADPTGALAFEFGKAQAKPGKVIVEMPNQAPIQHNIAIQGDGKGPIVGKGSLSSFTTTLKAGTYTYLCDVPGHAAAGMKGTLIVR
jgi:plastocyanin